MHGRSAWRRSLGGRRRRTSRGLEVGAVRRAQTPRGLVVEAVNSARTQNGHIRNDTRDVSRHTSTDPNGPICRKKCVPSDPACTGVTPRNFHGKEGVDGSSPSEGSLRRTKSLQMGFSVAAADTVKHLLVRDGLDSRRDSGRGQNTCKHSSPGTATAERSIRGQVVGTDAVPGAPTNIETPLPHHW
jgi:hypothetical protein